MGKCAIIVGLVLEYDTVWLQAATPDYDCGYPALWIVVRNPGLGDRSWPDWLAEEASLTLEEFEAKTKLGMEEAFLEAWAALDCLPSMLGVEAVKYVRLIPGLLAAMYVVRYTVSGGYHPAYIVYGRKPFIVLRRRSRRGTDKYARR